MTRLVTWAKDAYWVGDVAVLGVILLIGAILVFVRPRWGRRWLLATVVGYWWASTPLGSMLLSAPLVRELRALQDPAEAGPAGAIVVLGGGIEEVKAGPLAFSLPLGGQRVARPRRCACIPAPRRRSARHRLGWDRERRPAGG